MGIPLFVLDVLRSIELDGFPDLVLLLFDLRSLLLIAFKNTYFILIYVLFYRTPMVVDPISILHFFFFQFLLLEDIQKK